MNAILALRTFAFLFLAAAPFAASENIAGEEKPRVISAAKEGLATITVTIQRMGKKGRIREFILGSAPGFSVEGCDIVTDFDVVAMYYEDMYGSAEGPSHSMKLLVSIDGEPEPYEGIPRPVGMYPLGYNLACIDVQPKAGGKKPNLHRFSLANPSAAYPPEDIPAGLALGIPLIDPDGTIVAMIVPGEVTGTEDVLTVADIAKFIALVRGVDPAGPVLHYRPPEDRAAFSWRGLQPSVVLKRT